MAKAKRLALCLAANGYLGVHVGQFSPRAAVIRYSGWTRVLSRDARDQPAFFEKETRYDGAFEKGRREDGDF